MPKCIADAVGGDPVAAVEEEVLLVAGERRDRTPEKKRPDRGDDDDDEDAGSLGQAAEDPIPDPNLGVPRRVGGNRRRVRVRRRQRLTRSRVGRIVQAVRFRHMEPIGHRFRHPSSPYSSSCAT
jgi:hypothetical protein